VEVSSITIIQGREAIEYTGFAATNFFSNRHEAIEFRLKQLCGLADSINGKDNLHDQHIFRYWQRLSQQTLKAL
jgi:hypothetical protein